ncbi:TetR/AcrR family transcriptional regulator [Yoonia sp. I 8.24]|uniref:TetR/AcrR family transcriptional regulator n=1 Tax=Yoonia sp. I 8.24 TaxID=1537229 RepID=UPI001EDFBB63|nr:TetR/AcrR family transcriptional regulator [Yoonia sp. I 8.24]MCG3268620.1 TetR/AcrR family transcriptional regulator [Yoonia sp. I 8.24]
MRVTQEVADQNRLKVVEVASRKFREHGYDGIGVADLMKAAGLTHGGFYKQFKGKAALMVEATAEAMAANRRFWQSIFEKNDRPRTEAFRDAYLSNLHTTNISEGCCFASLAAQAHRYGPELQEVFGEGLQELVQMIEPSYEGEADEEALRTVSLLVGALVLSRAVGDHPIGEKVRMAAHNATKASPEQAET